jgi:anaphase-promoting complex subunit 8
MQRLTRGRAAEMLNSLEEPEIAYNENGRDADMHDDFGTPADENDFTVLSPTEDVSEARLERSELSRYLMAKSFFDCREFDRCAAVFLPMTLPKGEIAVVKQKSHNKTPHHGAGSELVDGAPHLSQKALFLALYAQYMAGEKRKDEESETLLGPNDGGATVNRELVSIQRHLKARFIHHSKRNLQSQGWLEYLYGIVLAKQKNLDEAKDWLIKSVNLYEYNWGAWQELGDLVENVQEVSIFEKGVHNTANPM